MAWIHRCEFCHWERAAASPTMLAPNCPKCGCLLTAVPASQAPFRAATPRVTGLSPLVHRSSSLARWGLVLGTLVAAATVGYRAAGPALAVAAVGGVGLALALALLPGR